MSTRSAPEKGSAAADRRPRVASGSRGEIMAIAIDCFARYGYQGTSIDRIAKAAGVTKGALYYHFKDKEELLFEAVKDRIAEFERRVVGSGHADRRSCRARCAEIGRVCVRARDQEQPPTLHRHADGRGARHQPPALGAVPRHDAPLPRAISPASSGSARSRASFATDVDAALAAQVFAGGVMGAEIQYYQDPERVDLAATMEGVVGQFIAWLTTRRSTAARALAPRRAPRTEGTVMISFELDEEQQLIRDTVVELRARSRSGRTAREADEKGDHPGGARRRRAGSSGSCRAPFPSSTAASAASTRR